MSPILLATAASAGLQVVLVDSAPDLTCVIC